MNFINTLFYNFAVLADLAAKSGRKVSIKEVRLILTFNIRFK